MNKQEVEMAIKQLKNDIDTVICVYKDTMLGKSKEHFIKCYETAISVLTQQLTDTWIPITEKLPDRLGEVMACNKDGLITIGYIRKREGYYTCEHLPFVTEDIIAWQPLPEPYEETPGDEYDGKAEYEEAMMDTFDVCDICDNNQLDICPYIENDDRESCPKYRKEV